jgi:hypothetical protein
MKSATSPDVVVLTRFLGCGGRAVELRFCRVEQWSGEEFGIGHWDGASSNGECEDSSPLSLRSSSR